MSLFKEQVELGIAETELGTQKFLGQFPPLARWLLIICVLAIIPAYFTAKSLSLKYWQNRYATYLVSAKPSFTNPKDPSVSPVTLIDLGNNNYAAAAAISNNNLNLSLKNTQFTINFYDATHNLVATYSDSFYLLPNQKKYLVVPKITATGPAVSAEVKLPPDLTWQQRLDLPQVNFTTTPATYNLQLMPLNFSVQGNFTNNSPYALNQVRIYIILLDSSGKIVGASQRDEFTVNPYERRAFVQNWPDFLPQKVASVQIIPDTYTLDNSNLSVPISNSGASNLTRPIK